MSISPPTDIVLDVARAADPTRYTQAAARLNRTAPAGDDFADFLNDARPPETAKPEAGDAAPSGCRDNHAGQAGGARRGGLPATSRRWRLPR